MAALCNGRDGGRVAALALQWRTMSKDPAPRSAGQAPALAVDGHVATLTLRRPAVANRLAAADLPVLRAHVDAVNRAEGVLVLLLRAEGRHFCSGFDIADMAASQTEGAGFGDMVDALEDCRAVTVAAVQGGVYGGATDIALACDFRVGSEAAQMFMPAARLGLHFYESGLRRYVERLGLDTAKRLFLTGETLDARAMREIGFLTHLVTPEALDGAVQALVAQLAGMAPLALLGMKRHLNRIARGTLPEGAVREATLRTLASDDLREGQLAWKEKRPARFTGR